MTRFYLYIIPNVDTKKGENYQFFGEITIQASPPIYTFNRPGVARAVLQIPSSVFQWCAHTASAMEVLVRGHFVYLIFVELNKRVP